MVADLTEADYQVTGAQKPSYSAKKNNKMRGLMVRGVRKSIVD